MSMIFDGENIVQVKLGDITFNPVGRTIYEIDGERAKVSDINAEETLSFRLETKEASGIFLIEGGNEIKMCFKTDKSVNNIAFTMSFPLDAVFHYSVYANGLDGTNVGRFIDREIPVGTSEYFRLGYQLLLININRMWMRITTKSHDSYRGKRDVEISRLQRCFYLTFSWQPPSEVFISAFNSMDEAVADYKYWLEKEFKIKKMKDDPNLPEWLHNVKLVLFIDMMRSNMEIAHDYQDVINLVKELKEIGAPKDTLLYIPGWNGPYDSTYPIYRPCKELGGEKKFKEMIKAIHDNGFRVMIHTNPWGLDPYKPHFEKWKKYAIKDKKGRYVGWHINGFLPKHIKYASRRIKIPVPLGTNPAIFETVEIPDKFEARFTIGNVGNVGNEKVKVTINNRTQLTSAKLLKGQYTFPFPFFFKPGRNKVKIEILGDVNPDWSNSWYEINHCNQYPDTWTYPIVHVNMDAPEWIKNFVEEVGHVVKKYKIDAVHLDAMIYEDAISLLESLKKELPHTPFSCEHPTERGLGYWTFSQNAKQFFSDKEEFKISPLPHEIGKDYIYFYPHLCYAESFVPVGKVCNIDPPKPSSRKKEEIINSIRNARKYNYIPGLRLNYRQYGIDIDSKEIIREIANYERPSVFK